MNLVEFIILALATYRISSLTADVMQGGPWNILNKIRYALGVRYDEFSNPYGTGVISRGLLCVYCNSIWIGLAIALVHLWVGSPSVYMFLPFALSAVAIKTDVM